MKTAEEYYESLLLIGESITNYYNQLEDLEFDFQQNTLEYQTVLHELFGEITKENSTLEEATTNGHLARLKELLDKDLLNKTAPSVILRHGHANLFRLVNLIETMYKDNTLQYVYALKYDIGYLLIAMIEELLNDEYYSDIRQDLISFRYSLIYCHIDLENAFLDYRLNLNSIKLTAYNRRLNLPGYRYIDKAVLIGESNESLIYLQNVSEFSYSSIKRFNVVISILNILARLTLCDEIVMNSLYKELMDLLEDERYPIELKEEINNMFNVLATLQNKLGITRN